MSVNKKGSAGSAGKGAGEKAQAGMRPAGNNLQTGRNSAVRKSRPVKANSGTGMTAAKKGGPGSKVSSSYGTGSSSLAVYRAGASGLAPSPVKTIVSVAAAGQTGAAAGLAASRAIAGGSSRVGSNREKLLATVQDSKLRGIVNDLYRPGVTVGDGGTADILIKEFYEGSSKHLIKAKGRLNGNKIRGIY